MTGAANAVWVALLVAGAVFEAFGIFNRADGDTLSERTRAWFHTDTKAGKVTFTVGFLGFAAWFLPHIIFGWNPGQ